jgi:hypothetical protein
MTFDTKTWVDKDPLLLTSPTPLDAAALIDLETRLASYTDARTATTVNVKRDFDAKGTGTLDDAPAIQAAVNWGAANGARFIYFPSGTYLINATIYVPPGIYFYGPGSIVKAANTLPGNHYMFTNSAWSAGQTDITFHGLEIDGNRINRGGSSAQIEFRGDPSDATKRAKRIRFKEVWIHGMTGPSTAFQNVEHLFFLDSIISDSARDGILGQCNIQQALIRGNNISDCDDDHIGMHSGPESTIQSSGVVIIENNLDGTGASAGHGIAVNGVDRFLVQANPVYQTYGAGILLSNHNAFQLSNGVVSNNDVINTGYGVSTSGNGEGYGMQIGPWPLDPVNSYYSTTAVANVHDISFIGNNVRGSLRDGIRLRSTASTTNLNFLGGESTNNGGYGFVVNGQSGLSVIGVDLRNNTSGPRSGSVAAGDVWLGNRGDIPNVTGSRGGSAALANLLTTLAGTGVITDGTSA